MLQLRRRCGGGGVCHPVRVVHAQRLVGVPAGHVVPQVAHVVPQGHAILVLAIVAVVRLRVRPEMDNIGTETKPSLVLYRYKYRIPGSVDEVVSRSWISPLESPLKVYV